MAELSPGFNLSHYRVLSKIGAGGMGEVYLARDTKLDRKVALKILPADLAANHDRMRRFVQEAKAAAALNHPNIAHVYEIGEHDGTNFIAMEFIEGNTLREKIHRAHTELKQLLRYLQHAAEGLAKAHAAGIVHRDLKPDNIMITREGHAKILDFGLAKLIERPPTLGADSSEVATAVMPQHSTPGTVMGTVGYMSPEQAQGKTKEIDHRSDIFSFGCILFEAVTGQKPFEGESVIKSLHMVVYEPAPPITDLNPSAPPELQRIVRRCLAKDPDERYQSIKEVAIELKELRRELEGAGLDTTVPPPQKFGVPPSGGIASSLQTLPPEGGTPSTHPPSSAEYVVSGIKKHKLTVGVALAVLLILIFGAGFWSFKTRRLSGGGTNSINSIAVLPFQNKSVDADTDYLSDGLAESLIFRLSQIPGLKVSPTSSVMRYKGKDTDVAKIASELSVDAVMTGRLIKRGDNLNITVELVDTKNNKSLWGEQYERKMSDLLATQREIASTIAQKLQLRLAGTETKGITKKYTDNNDAYQLYLKGRFYFARRSDADIRRSIDLFQQAIKLDPSFALAYTGVGESWEVMPSYPYMESKDAMPLAKAAIAKALELDPELPEAHTVAGMIAATYDWDWAKSESEFKRSLELDPNLAITHYRYAWVFLSPMGRREEAIAEMSRAMELEPLSLVQGANFAGVYIYARQYDRALDQARKTYDMDPTLITGQNWMCHALDINGKYAESLAISEKVSQTNGLLYAALGYAYAKSGHRQEAEAVLAKLNEVEKTKTVSHYWEAITYAALGEKDKAFAELEKAYQARDWFLQRLKVDPFLDPLRDDQRFGDLVKRIGLPQ
jgi:serine/threonine protein kinase/tetratricopeptide (TPR) repeat protein